MKRPSTLSFAGRPREPRSESSRTKRNQTVLLLCVRPTRLTVLQTRPATHGPELIADRAYRSHSWCECKVCVVLEREMDAFGASRVGIAPILELFAPGAEREVYEYSKFSTSSLRVREYKIYMQVLHQNILSTLLVYECENMKFTCNFSIKPLSTLIVYEYENQNILSTFLVYEYKKIAL